MQEKGVEAVSRSLALRHKDTRSISRYIEHEETENQLSNAFNAANVPNDFIRPALPPSPDHSNEIVLYDCLPTSSQHEPNISNPVLNQIKIEKEESFDDEDLFLEALGDLENKNLREQIARKDDEIDRKNKQAIEIISKKFLLNVWF